MFHVCVFVHDNSNTTETHKVEVVFYFLLCDQFVKEPTGLVNDQFNERWTNCTTGYATNTAAFFFILIIKAGGLEAASIYYFTGKGHLSPRLTTW